MQGKADVETLVRRGRQRKRFAIRQLITILACCVTFVTVYFLILPAVTVTHQTYCGYEEHIHNTDCYEARKFLRCTLEEGEQTHIHTDICYVSSRRLVCTLAEDEDHTHTDTCYEATKELICTMDDTPHVHTDTCYRCEDVLVCPLTEHKHTESCWVNRNQNACADIESEENWEAMAQSLELTDSVSDNLLRIADSQVGYRESVLNYIVSDDGAQYGTTRFAQWAGDEYCEWNTAFASFCLAYSGSEWNTPITDVSELEAAMGMYRRNPDEYEAEKGDLIFFDTDSDMRTDRVGIAYDISDEQITLIEGDCEGRVEYHTVEIPTVTAYGALAGYTNYDEYVLTSSTEEYAVSVRYSRHAGIPAGTDLQVREIENGSDEYAQYLEMSQNTVAADEYNAISFARFFDISLVYEDRKIEPRERIDVSITYSDEVNVAPDEKPLAVHFAEDARGNVTEESIETLQVMTTRENCSSQSACDTFEFSLDSLSVAGTVIIYNSGSNYTQAICADFDELQADENTYYIIYARLNDRYYAIDGNGNAVRVYKSGNSITGLNNNRNLFWKFSSQGSNNYLVTNVGTSRHLHSFYNAANNKGTTTAGAYTSNFVISGTGENKIFKPMGNNRYPYLTSAYAFDVTDNVNTAAGLYLGYIATVPKSQIYVWLDGTCGGMMQYYGFPDTETTISTNNSGQANFTLPSVFPTQSSAPAWKYEYKLNGWYNIKTHTYHNPGETVTLTNDAVFYPDWVASTYDVGQNNGHVVDTVDTDKFITTNVFDYNAIFDMQAEQHTGTVSDNAHNEYWSVVQTGTVPYNNQQTFDFVFFDWDRGNTTISYPANRDVDGLRVGSADYTGTSYDDGLGKQDNRSYITQDIIDDCPNLMYQLFGTDNAFDNTTKTGILGKTYLGTANHLYQYMDTEHANYDGIHNGYYYYDSKLNAASYNQSDRRFYVYDYLERTADSPKDGGGGVYSDFLPYNSPYANNPAGHTIVRYDNAGNTSANGPNYQYDAKAQPYTQGGVTYNNTGNVTTNYWVGMSSEITFFLPNATGELDLNHNYGNQSVSGQDMTFEFSGDDDVWVFVDGELILDIGGLHGIKTGMINFSTGRWQTISNEDRGLVSNGTINLDDGEHTLIIYYLERGGSQSNCAIYFNISPRYECVIEKQDYYSKQKLNGAVFGVYTNPECTIPAELWDSEQDHIDHPDSPKNEFTCENGVTECWGMCAGKTYYIEEISPPSAGGYEVSLGIVRITLDNHGEKTYEVTMIDGAGGEISHGYSVSDFVLDPQNMELSFTITNKQAGVEEVIIRAAKEWQGNYTELPQGITLYVTANGERASENVTLSADDNWEYHWTGLRKFDAHGDPIDYKVVEVDVPYFVSYISDAIPFVDNFYWEQAAKLDHGEKFIFTNSNMALKARLAGQNTLEWGSTANAESLNGEVTAQLSQWTATALDSGYRLTNDDDGVLTFDSSNNRFYIEYGPAPAGCTQLLFYRNGKLYTYYNNTLHYFSGLAGGFGTASDTDALGFAIYRLTAETAGSGYSFNVTNVYIEPSNQTALEVHKTWADPNDTAPDVTIHLLADGRDTGRTLVLGPQNGWEGSFEGLQRYRDPGDQSSEISYTVSEEFMFFYEPTYGSVTVAARETAPAQEIVSWNTETNFSANKQFRIRYNTNNVLAVNPVNNALVYAAPSDSDNYQLWTAEANGTGWSLINVATGRRINYANNNFNTAANGAQIVYQNNKLYRSARTPSYITYNNGAVGSTNTQGGGANFTLLSKSVSYTPATYADIYSITVTNTRVSRKLPATGGAGTTAFTAVGIGVFALSFSGLLIKRRKRRFRG